MDNTTTLPDWMQQAVADGLLPLSLAQEINRRYPGATPDSLPPEIKQALNTALAEVKPSRQALARSGSEALNQDLARQLVDGAPR